MIEVTGINDSNGNSLWVKETPTLPAPTISISGNYFNISTNGVSGVKYYCCYITGANYQSLCDNCANPTTSNYNTTRDGSGDNSTAQVVLSSGIRRTLKVMGTKSGYKNSTITCASKTY